MRREYWDRTSSITERIERDGFSSKEFIQPGTLRRCIDDVIYSLWLLDTERFHAPIVSVAVEFVCFASEAKEDEEHECEEGGHGHDENRWEMEVGDLVNQNPTVIIDVVPVGLRDCP